jgi:hypothetical protein
MISKPIEGMERYAKMHHDGEESVIRSIEWEGVLWGVMRRPSGLVYTGEFLFFDSGNEASSRMAFFYGDKTESIVDVLHNHLLLPEQGSFKWMKKIISNVEDIEPDYHTFIAKVAKAFNV